METIITLGVLSSGAAWRGHIGQDCSFAECVSAGVAEIRCAKRVQLSLPEVDGSHCL